ncbi:MAG: hypothetical protein LBH59_02905 [Planctomycetaceae bacterium]|nr:hypothetical protein [Planctomycetaceae bacterium]
MERLFKGEAYRPYRLRYNVSYCLLNFINLIYVFSKFASSLVYLKNQF